VFFFFFFPMRKSSPSRNGLESPQNSIHAGKGMATERGIENLRSDVLLSDVLRSES